VAVFKGTVDYRAKVRGNGLSFPSLDFNPKEPGVDKVVIEGPKGDEIVSTVHLSSVASHADGRELAKKVNTAALNRIAYFRCVTIENAQSTGDQFSPLNQQPGVQANAVNMNLFIGGAAHAVLGVKPAELKSELELASPPGEHHFGLFRSARQSISPVEEFMHLHNILLMIYNDRQADVDAFAVGEDPAVPRTQHPLKAAGAMETVYTRLRNELAHKRLGVNLDNTKAEMTNRLGGLIALTKRAIGLHP